MRGGKLFIGAIYLASCGTVGGGHKGTGEIPGPDAALSDTAVGRDAGPVECDPSVDPNCPGACDGVSLAEGGDVEIREECAGTGPTVVEDPWNAAIEWQYTVEGSSGVIVMPAVGNLTDDNSDGAINEYDTPDVAFVTWDYPGQLMALSGNGGALLFALTGFNGDAGVSIADVNGDGAPEIIAASSSNEVVAVSGAGTVLWRSPPLLLSSYPQPTIADLDEDGTVEVIFDSAIINGADGSIRTNLNWIDTSWRTPVVADLDLDGSAEIILGNSVFNGSGTLLWTNPSSDIGNFAAVANIDGDREGEVFFASGSQIYEHDSNGALIRSFPIPGTSPGPPAVADFDGDGAVEIAVPANTQISVFEIDGTRLWTSTISDYSGLAGCSGYDVDGDGAYEVLYADENDFRIYDGRTGVIRYINGSHSSGTVWEYPVVADVDNDGSAEIVIASNGYEWHGITVFGHAGDGWPKSGTTWPTHDFAMTNVLSDGSVPRVPDSSWLAYNVFRARPSVDSPGSADLSVEFTDSCLQNCLRGPVSFALQVTNQGGSTVREGTSLAVYVEDLDHSRRLASTLVLPQIPAGQRATALQVDIPSGDLGSGIFYAVVDDDGFGNGRVVECDETNNEARHEEALCFIE